MADDLKRVGLTFKADGTADFQKALKDVNTAVSENYAEFKLAQSQWDKNTKALTKLGDKQKYLQGQTALYSDKVSVLREQLKEMSDAEGKNSEKIEKKKQKLNETQTALENYRNKVDKLSAELSKLESEEDKNETAIEKKRQELEKAQKAVADYGERSDKLATQIDKLEKSEGKNENAIAKKKAELIKAQAKLNEYNKELKDVDKELEKGTANLKEYADKLEKTGEKATDVGKKMTKGVTAPIVGAGTAAVKTAADFESAMSQVQATMGITKDATSEVSGQTVNTMDSLNELAKTMGEKTAFSASECAEALNYLALAGYDAQDMTDTLPTVLNLAAAGGIDLASASDMVTDAMSALGMGVSEADTMVDQMSKTASTTNTSVAQLGEGILTIGATAKSIKGGTAELNTALGILANNGIKGAEGGTHLRNVILSLQNPTDAASGKLKELGVAVYDSEGNMRSMNDILGDLNNSMNGMTSEEKSNIISTIFNKTDLAAVNSLLDNTGTAWDDLQNAIADSGGAAQQMADTQLDNLEGQLTLLKSALEGLAISIGEILMPYIKNCVEHVQKLVDKFNGLDEGTKKTIVTIALIVAAIGPLILIFGMLAGSASKIITLSTQIIGICIKAPGMISTIGAGAKTLWGILAANPIVLIIAAVVALIAIFVTLYNKCEWFRDGVNAIFGGIRDFIKGVIDKIKGFFNFEWKLPKIKLPHFKASGEWSLVPPKVPKFSVDWYANGGILNSPTIFGMNGDRAMGGGEAGAEAVLPIDLLKTYIRDEMQANNAALAQLIAEALSELTFVIENNIELGDKKLAEILTDAVIKKMSQNIKWKRGAAGA